MLLRSWKVVFLMWLHVGMMPRELTVEHLGCEATLDILATRIAHAVDYWGQNT